MGSKPSLDSAACDLSSHMDSSSLNRTIGGGEGQHWEPLAKCLTWPLPPWHLLSVKQTYCNLVEVVAETSNLQA